MKIFQDKTFPRHIADLMNLMHMMVFQGTDGEEQWENHLNLRQKEVIALGLARYYQCDHCVEHHLSALRRLDNRQHNTLNQNINAMILFLRVDTRAVGADEQEHWVNAWSRFAKILAVTIDDPLLPYMVGLAIGIARDDAFLIDFAGREVVAVLKEQDKDARATVGEIESVVIFMKAAASKNRVVDKIEPLFTQE